MQFVTPLHELPQLFLKFPIPYITKRSNRKNNNNKYNVCMIPWHVRFWSSCVFYFSVVCIADGLGFPILSIFPVLLKFSYSSKKEKKVWYVFTFNTKECLDFFSLLKAVCRDPVSLQAIRLVWHYPVNRWPRLRPALAGGLKNKSEQWYRGVSTIIRA